MAPAELNVSKMAMIGAGSMGGGMALLFAEHGLTVSIKDPSREAMDKVAASAKEAGVGERVKTFDDYKSLCESLDKPKVIAFSLPHGHVGDGVLDDLMPYLSSGDIILDAANEHYVNTERRQGLTATKGIRYVGVGVSGGYQAARRGPSMCPGGDEQTLGMILPLLRRVAAKDVQGEPCVAHCGFGGSGHYVKMLHNGIEHGMMSAISEAWQVMSIGLGMSYDEIADVFEAWNASGELRGTFLIKISADICRAEFGADSKKNEEGKRGRVLSTVLDKVVQDLTGEEGTGVWSNMEAVRLHIPAPTMTTAHYLRLASAYRGQREKVAQLFSSNPASKASTAAAFPPRKFAPPLPAAEKVAFLESLRTATYTAVLASYTQGLAVIEAANRENKWAISYPAVRQIWRAGCIIQSEHISDAILAPVFDSWTARGDGTPHPDGAGESLNLLLEPCVVKGLRTGYPALKAVLSRCLEGDFVVPALSATLEYVKYVSNADLPTDFYEAQLDYFGAHMYDEKDEAADVPLPTEGKHHFEWKKA